MKIESDCREISLTRKYEMLHQAGEDEDKIESKETLKLLKII